MRRVSPSVITLVIAWLVFMAWIAWGYVIARGVTQPPFSVLERYDGYVVREYEPYFVAQVSSVLPWADALDAGTSILTGYIRGDNVTQESIAFVQSVGIEEEPEGSQIALSAPLVAQEKGDTFLISYILPEGYTVSTIPRPNNPAIRILEVPAAVAAVRSFSGTADRQRFEREEAELRRLLTNDKRVTVSAARFVQYNPAWIPPFLRRNEVIIPVTRGR